MPQRLLRVNALVNERRSLQSGAVAFFQKPANEVELMGVIRANLRSAWGWITSPS
jgi:FixJ family two-component response regulator